MIGALILAATLSVNLDVKDAKARDVLQSLQKQCAVKNLIVDPDVPEGNATFYFHDVPCRTAFDVVLSTYKLKAVEYSTSTVSVERNNG